jgi:negative regulator of sigma E activity
MDKTRTKLKTVIKPVALAASVLTCTLLGTQIASAQNNAPAATATRPATTPPDQTSVPNNAPPATTTQTTGTAPKDETIEKMNEEEKQKVNTEGK